MSNRPFFPLRLDSVKDLGIALRELAQRFNKLASDQDALVTTVDSVKQEVEADTSSGGTSGTTTEVSSVAHGLAPQSPGDPTQFLNGDHTPSYAHVKDSDLSLSDVTSNDVSSTKHGLTPKSPADATKFLNGDVAPTFALVKGSDLSMADVTTNNVSIAQHGFAPKAPNDATKYLDGLGGYSIPGGTTYPPALPTFPLISNLQLRLSAELSTMTVNPDGFVSQINDMTGNWGSNFTPPGGVIPRPRLVRRGMAHMRPGLVFDGVSAKLAAGAIRTLAQPFTIVAVLMNWKGGAGNNNVFRDSNFGPVLFQSGSNWSIDAGVTLNDSNLYGQNTRNVIDGDIAAPAVAITVFNGASSAIYNNGVVSAATNAGTNGISGTLYVGGDSATSFMHGVLYELLAFGKVLNGTELAQINAYYAAALEIYQ